MAIPGAVVVVVVAVLVVVATAGHNSPPASSGPLRQPAPAEVVADVTGVPASVFDQVGAPSGLVGPKRASGGQVLTAGGKPEAFFIGEEWCPICATERWPVVVALSRFGTFNNLSVTRSSDTDSYPRTNTFSFYRSSYSSPYLALSTVELANRVQQRLEQPTSTELSLDQTLGGGTVPLTVLGGRYYVSSSQYNPGVLSGLTWQQIAADLAHPTTSQGDAVQRGIVGSANLLTAALCRVTGQQPTAVCTSTGVKVAAGTLASSAAGG